LTATDHDVSAELRGYIAKARLRRGIELVKLANRIEALRTQIADDDEDNDVPANSAQAVGNALLRKGSYQKGLLPTDTPVTTPEGGKTRLSRAVRGAIFREVVLAKVREMKEAERTQEMEKTVNEKLQQK
jgi:calcium/calmodulin-dependent protein kinase I